MTDREPAVHQISSPNVCAIAPPPRLLGVHVAGRIADVVTFTRCWEFASGRDPVACKMVTSSWPAFCERLLQGDLFRSRIS